MGRHNSIDVRWLDADQNILYWGFPEHWAWADVQKALKRSALLRRAAYYKPQVAIVADLQQSKERPKHSLTYLQATFAKVDKRDFVVLVSAAPFVRFVVMTFRQLARNSAHRLTLVNTLEEAYAIIRSQSDWQSPVG